MQTKTYERIVISKGSVIVLNSINKEQIQMIKNGIGVYLAEGFGDVLLNPSFLNSYEINFKKENETSNRSTQNIEIKSNIAKFLKNRQDRKKEKLETLNRVDDFIEENKSLYKSIKPSQWGNIRSICTSGADDFKDEIEKYISKGTKKWEEKQIDTLLKNEYNLEFIKLISIQMPKQGDKDA